MREAWNGAVLAFVASGLAAAPALADIRAGVAAWTKGDYKAAVEQWREPAIAGDPDAQFNLGQAYKLGRGVPPDAALAESWFHKAALQNHRKAIDAYGIALYQAGRKEEAAPWLEKSVARGEPRTQLVLGTMLFNGDGVPRDYARAYALMTGASRAGLLSAAETLAQMDQFISPADRERGTALAAQYAAQTKTAGGETAPPPSHTLPTPTIPLAHSGAARVERPRLMSKPVAAPTPRGWRVQLGAFRDAAGAHLLWRRVAGRFGGSPFYVAGDGVTRLQVGPFADKAAAAHACTLARTPCLVVAPS